MTTRPIDPHHDDRVPLPRSAGTGPVGPAAHLIGLPSSDGLARAVPEEVDAHLSQIESVRQRQLDTMPTASLDAVSAAHRGSVERILDEVRTARRRLGSGLYGICVGCAGAISPERLQLRPWAARCASCASRDRI
jgi:RNA polymerase-binding transcription factor DksA